MLVLSRKINETILIGDEIRITLLDVEGDKIKIGIEAPKALKIFREELLEATRSTNQQALNAPVVSFGVPRKKTEKAEKTEEAEKVEEAETAAKEEKADS